MSVETALGELLTEGGLLKQPREPVLALANPVQHEQTVSCDWVFTHPGLVPGPYRLTNGTTVVIPPALCPVDGRAVPDQTLEVT